MNKPIIFLTVAYMALTGECLFHKTYETVKLSLPPNLLLPFMHVHL